MERDPEYYKTQALEKKQQYEKLEKKRIKTSEDNRRIKGLKQQALRYLELYHEAKSLQKRKNELDNFLQRGVPSNEDVREDAAEIGIDIDNLDKSTEEELEELGGPSNIDIEPENLPPIEGPVPPPPPVINSPYRKTVKSNATPLSPIPPPENKTRKNPPLGFTETLTNSTKQSVISSQVNPNICDNIFINGSKVTKKYFYPSEFPKLTKIKPITLSIKKGGKKNKKKSRKLRKNKIKNLVAL